MSTATLSPTEVAFDCCTSEPIPEPGSAEWLERRKTGVGGSEVAGILGLSRYSTALDIYLTKVGLADAKPDNIHMALGRHMEPFIVRQYEEATGYSVARPQVMFRSRENPVLIANTDGLVPQADRGLEVKHTAFADAWGPSGSDIYPEDYFLQCQHYMLVTGLPAWDLCAFLSGPKELRIYTVSRDETICGAIRDSVLTFWREHVEARVPPPMDYEHQNALQLVRRKFPAVSEGEIDLPAELASIAEEYQALKGTIADAGKRADALKAQLLDHIGEAAAARIAESPYRLTRKLVKRPGYTAKPTEFVDFRISTKS